MKFEKFGLGVLTVTRSKQKSLRDVLEAFIRVRDKLLHFEKNMIHSQILGVFFHQITSYLSKKEYRLHVTMLKQ